MLLSELDDGAGRETLAAPDIARGLLISDYLVSLVSTIESNLDQLIFHANQHQEKCYSHETAFRLAAKAHVQAGGTGFPPPTAHLTALLVAIDAHQTSFVVTAGSILDNLAALTIGVGGFDAPLVKADVLDIQALLPAERNERNRSKRLMAAGSVGRQVQDRILDAVAAGLAEGPADWVEWLLDFRNTLVHRASRIQTVHFEDRTLHRVMPRDPARTTIEAMRRSDQRDVDLSEDARKTLNGLTVSIANCVGSVVSALVSAWDERRRFPGEISQPEGQWPRLEAPTARRFEGYEPGSIPSLKPGAALYVHPTLGKRLKAGQLFDGASGAWAQWIPDESGN
jgi:hypothetical protein